MILPSPSRWEIVATSPSIPIRAYRDGFSNWCNRIVAPAGRTRLSANGIVKDTGEPDVVAADANQHAVEDLPDDALPFLLASRYWRPTGFPRSHGRCSGRRRKAGTASRPSATMFTSTLPSAMNTLAQIERLGKPTAIAPASAAIMRTSPSPSVAA